MASAGLGRGSTFTFEIPIMEAAPAIPARKATETLADERPSKLLPNLKGIVALVIDDQEYTREIVAAILKRAGAEVHTAGSVRQGLLLFDEIKPGVVVCDIAMPEADGYVFLKEVRQLDHTVRRTPILALTAFGRPEDRLRALNAGFDAYLKKPVDPAELAETVEQLAHR